MTRQERDRIEAAPTKAFFIEMLIKDITLVDAIADLVDNSVDGARRIQGGSQDFQGLWIRLTAQPDRFEISDNCGGIPTDIARSYAFRFGRPRGFPTIEHSVGQFGVGMKRALFKLGRRFAIASTTDSHRFLIDIDVEEWRKDDQDWHFDWKDLEELDSPPDPEEQGTKITVSHLHANVAQDFGLASFEKALHDKISSNHRMNMDEGLQISLNGVPVGFDLSQLLADSSMKPAYAAFAVGSGERSVDVKVFAGLGKSSPREAGWYIFCNGRQVVGANRTELTGWDGKGGVVIPKFHNQYARFRGFVFFDADDASLLPWNTTKTGVDEDADVYRTVKTRMVQMMRPVIDFLNRLDQEKDDVGQDETGPLEDAVDRAPAHLLGDLGENGTFTAPKPGRTQRKPKTGRIQYDRPADLIAEVKQALGIRTYKQVGEETFDYFVDMEELGGE